MRPFLADAIDLPIVLTLGLAIGIPLIAFQTITEAWVLSKIWRLPAGSLRSLTLRANMLSLLAGILTKIFNAVLYGLLLSSDLVAYYTRYTAVTLLGTAIYFAVTVLVEVVVARGWTRETSTPIPPSRIWKGILWANILTYLVVSPLHYIVTRPTTDIRDCSSDAGWASNASTKIVFLDSKTQYLESKLIGNDSPQTIVPRAITDYIISADLNVCLFRDTNNALGIWRKNPPLNNTLFTSSRRLSLNRFAFSPSGDRIAHVSDGEKRIEVLNSETGQTIAADLPTSFEGTYEVIWTTREDQLVIGSETNSVRFLVSISPKDRLLVEKIGPFTTPALLPCYTRDPFRTTRFGGGYPADSCGSYRVSAVRGLQSYLRVSRTDAGSEERGLHVAANHGLLHLGGIQFWEAAFLDDCAECLITAGNQTYLLNIQQRRLGFVARGFHSTPLTPRFLKNLQDGE